MSANGYFRRRSVLLSLTFVGTVIVGSLTMLLVCTFAPPAVQLAVLGVLLSVLGGLFFAYLLWKQQDDTRRDATLEKLALLLTLAPEHELFKHYMAFCQALAKLAENPQDTLFRQIALLRLASVTGQIGDLAKGIVSFAGTEEWLAIYELLLKSPSIHEFHCVTWVRQKEHELDQAARQSTTAICEAVHTGVLIERILILRDDFWPKGQTLPANNILPWIEQQNNHGIWIRLIRESDLAAEPDLLGDFGIFGNKAFAVWEPDEQGRTRQFVVHFGDQAVRAGQERWQRLVQQAAGFRNLLDQDPSSG